MADNSTTPEHDALHITDEIDMDMQDDPRQPRPSIENLNEGLNENSNNGRPVDEIGGRGRASPHHDVRAGADQSLPGDELGDQDGDPIIHQNNHHAGYGSRGVGLLGQPLKPRRGGLGPQRGGHARNRVIPNSPESVQEPVVPPVTKNTVKKIKKKPGPKPSTKPPVNLKDKAAKEALIREIEALWGKDFIKNYIPKVHRPLTKRKKGKARTYNRRHDDNPRNWLPSVLKCILSLAKKTNDKMMLKKLMADVVRMRNQHTGNKKPQLVTTDFDVMEDVLDHGWTVVMAFNVRYKHLLNNRLSPTDTKERDEYYKDLFNESNSDYDSAEEEDAEDDQQYELQNEFQDDISDNHRSSSVYHNDLPQPGYGQPPRGYGQPFPVPPPSIGGRPRMHQSQATPRYGPSYPPMHAGGYDNGYGNGYDDGYGNPMMTQNPRGRFAHSEAPRGRGQVQHTQRRPVDDYGQPVHPYRTPSSFSGSPNMHTNGRDFHQSDGFNHGGQSRNGGRDPQRRPHHSTGHNKADARPRAPAPDGNGRSRINQSMESSPDTPLARGHQHPRGNGNMPPPPAPFARASPMPYIKPEPRDDDDEFSFNNGPGSGQGFSASHGHEDMMIDTDDGINDGANLGASDDHDPEEELRAELELAEAKARAAKLRLKAMNAKKKSRGPVNRDTFGTASNPMSLD